MPSRILSKAARFAEHLMTPVEYAGLHHMTPYTYELEAQGQFLFYFGARHSNDPTHKMFAQLTASLARFGPDIVFIEGNPRVNTASQEELMLRVGDYTQEQIVRQYGESGLALWWALEHRVPIYSPEPADSELMAAMQAKGFSQDELFAYETATILSQWHRQSIKPTLEEYLDRFYSHWASGWGWNEYEFSLAHYIKIHVLLYGKPFDSDDRSFFQEASDPIPWPDKSERYSSVNKAAAAVSYFRDAYALNKTLEWFVNGKKRIFIVYGSSHAVMQEPALRCMFDNFRKSDQRL